MFVTMIAVAGLADWQGTYQLSAALWKYDRVRREAKSVEIWFEMAFTDGVLGTEEKSSGFVAVLRNSEGQLFSKATIERDEEWDTYLLEPKRFHVLDSRNKTHQLFSTEFAKDVFWRGDLCPFCFLSQEEFLKRYSIRVTKHDRFYTYLDLIPKRGADEDALRWFRNSPSRWQVVLQRRPKANRFSFTPKRLWQRSVNGSESIINITNFRLDSGQLTEDDFKVPPLAKDWKVIDHGNLRLRDLSDLWRWSQGLNQKKSE